MKQSLADFFLIKILLNYNNRYHYYCDLLIYCLYFSGTLNLLLNK